MEDMTVDKSYIVLIKNFIDSITKKLMEETNGGVTALTPDELHIVQTSSVPIISIISLEMALKGHGVDLATEEYAELVAFDDLISYLD